jgi:predicted phage terminase large subunit-like protein
MLLNGTDHTAIEGFRESAKDQIVNRAFPLHCIMFPSVHRSFIVFIRNNDTQATRSIEEIENEALTNPFIRSCIKKIIKKTANAFIVVVNDGTRDITVRFEGYGKGASIRGLATFDKRPDIIIANDLQDMEDSQSDKIQEDDWNWFLSDVKFLGQYTRIFLIGNNLGEKCIIERIFADPASVKFSTMRVAICDDAMQNSTWAAKYPIAEIVKEREDYTRIGKLDIWLRERMCIAVSDENRVFLESDFQYYNPSLAERLSFDGTVIATLDPASSKNVESCLRAITVLSVMPDGHWYTLEMPYGRWDSVELIDKMFQMVIKWGIRSFGVEKGQLQQFLEPFLYKEMTRRNIRFSLIPLEHGKMGSKLQRILMLQPRFKCKSMWFPDNAYWLAELKSELAGVTRTQIKSMFIDMVDSLAMCEQMVKIPLSGDPRLKKHKAAHARRAKT